MSRPRFAVRSLAVGLVVAAVAGAPSASADARKDAALEAAVRVKRIPQVRFADTSLAEAAKWLQVATGWNVVVRTAVIEKAGIDLSAVRYKLELADVTVAGLLRVMLEPHGLVWKVEGNIVHVTTKADAQGKPVMVLYPISHLTWTKMNFRGPDIDLHPSGFTVSDDAAEEEEDETDPFRDPQHVADLVKEMVDATWTEEGWSLTATKQWLMVKAPRSVQRQVARALAQMAALK
jgi:hypothetical protein